MPFLFFVSACVELFGLIKIGQIIGGGAIFGEILLSGVLGVVLLRVSVGNALAGMVVSLFAGRFSLRDLLRRRELRLLLSGVLLLVPGMLSDLVGLILLGHYFLLPSRREPTTGEETIDVEYEVYDDRSLK